MQKRLSLLLCSPLLALATSPVSADEPIDVVLIGGGIMSATLGTYLQELEPEWDIHLYERLGEVAQERTLLILGAQAGLLLRGQRAQLVQDERRLVDRVVLLLRQLLVFHVFHEY